MFFYAGNKKGHFTTYTHEVAFITATTDSDLTCYDTGYQADDPTTFETAYSGTDFTTITAVTDVWVVMTSGTFSNYMNAQTESTSVDIFTAYLKEATANNGL